MLCSRNSTSPGADSVPVYLNVYDLTPINGYAYWFGLGVYHSGVQVHGVEYAYGAHEYPTSGIFEGEPKKNTGFHLRKTIMIGKTVMSITEVRIMTQMLAEQYKGNAYNLITKNCNHFCNDACLKLTGNPIPSWINRLAKIGLICNCVIPPTFNAIRARVHRVEEDKASTKSSSSSTSPLDHHSVRGRSRIRSPIPSSFSCVPPLHLPPSPFT